MRYKHFKPWLGILNRYLLQWFFVRVYIKVEDLMWVINLNGKVLKIGLMFWVYPLSGYGESGYKSVFKHAWYIEQQIGKEFQKLQVKKKVDKEFEEWNKKYGSRKR